MASSKLKNIILIILAITNVLLMLLLGTQRLEKRRSQDQALSDAISLLSQQGIVLDRSVLPRDGFASTLEFERDSAWEQSIFTALLGPDTTLTQRGMVSLYAGSNGQADVRGDGTFSVSLLPGALPLAGDDLEAKALEALKKLDISCAVIQRTDSSVTLCQTLAVGSDPAVPVFSCTITVTAEAGSLAQISGHRLVGQPAPASGQEQALSLATLLVRFRAGIIDTGDACSAIEALTPGCVLSTVSGGASRLTPVLRVDTDVNRYYVNALTGELTRV